MKTFFKVLSSGCILAALFFGCDKYDDTALRNDISDLKDRVKTLEDKVSTMNGNISSLQSVIAGLNGKVFVNSVTETSDGYVISFSDGRTATITNGKDGSDGKDGKDGKDGQTPQVGVKPDTDGIWYWTLNDEWLLDGDGNKLPVTGNDGKDGANGNDGADGITPKLTIEDGYWYISTDNGESWTQFGKATGDNGADGADGDSFFQGVYFTDEYVWFVLNDEANTTIQLSRGAHGVQAINVVPSYSDGSAEALDEEFDLRFKIVPAKAAQSLEVLDESCYRLDAVYTKTKANPGDFASLIFTKKTIVDDVLTLTVDSNSLAEEFTNGSVGLSARLVIDDGKVAVSSGYFPLKFYSPYGGHKVVDLGLPSGLLWATMNVGATKPEETGDYFAWGETEPKTVFTWDNYKWGTDENPTKYNSVDCWTQLLPEDDAATANWGDEWRMPTLEEIKELIDNSAKKTIEINGIYGVRYTGPNGNQIFIPYADAEDGSDGFWLTYTSCINGYNSACLAFNSNHLAWSTGWRTTPRNDGLPVRPVYGVNHVQSISIPETLTLKIGDTEPLKVTFVPENATYKNLTWVSSDPSVVKVDNKGTVTAVSVGTAAITVISAESGQTAVCAVTVKDPYNGHDYVDLGLSVKWATCNVGATKPEAYGDYFAWGETEPKENYSWLTYKFRVSGDSYNNVKFNKYCTQSSYWGSSEPMDNKIFLDLEDDAANVIMGGSWRMPKYSELKELCDNCTRTWTTQNGVNGQLFTSKTNGNSIFLPAAGFAFSFAGQAGFYLSSTVYTSSPTDAEYLYLSSSSAAVYGTERFRGCSVRAVCAD